MQRRKVHYNRTQLKAALINANEETIIAPRGDGKTEGILARKIVDDVKAMPRSLQVLCHRDFESMLTKTLPPLIKGFEKLGYIKDYHYLIGRTAPSKWRTGGKWELPYFPVQKSEYFIHWWNGAGIQLVSFNRENSANGVSCDSIKADEAKMITGKYKQRFDEELVPAMRGNREHFSHYSGWQGITYTTDQPTTSAAQWLYDLEKNMDPLQIEVIEGIQYEIAFTRQQLTTAVGLKRERLFKKLNRLNVDLNEARMNSSFYYEAPPLQNLEVLGEETYKRWLRVLPWPVFRSSILNERLVEVEDGFYPALDDETHVIDYQDSYLEDLAHDNNFAPESLTRDNSRHDPDIDPNEPLELGVDWGDAINCLVVGQPQYNEYHISNAMFVKKPDRIQDLALKFAQYYRYHKFKHVILPHDHTAYGGHGVTDTTYVDAFANTLRDNDWTVQLQNIGRTKSPEFRYHMWNNLLIERDPNTPRIRLNKHNTSHLVISMQQTKAKQGRNGVEKDKSAEKDRIRIKQEDAPHLSDAADTLMVYKFKNTMAGYQTGDVGNIMS